MKTIFVLVILTWNTSDIAFTIIFILLLVFVIALGAYSLISKKGTLQDPTNLQNKESP